MRVLGSITATNVAVVVVVKDVQYNNADDNLPIFKSSSK